MKNETVSISWNSFIAGSFQNVIPAMNEGPLYFRILRQPVRARKGHKKVKAFWRLQPLLIKANIDIYLYIYTYIFSLSGAGSGLHVKANSKEMQNLPCKLNRRLRSSSSFNQTIMSGSGLLALFGVCGVFFGLPLEGACSQAPAVASCH